MKTITKNYSEKMYRSNIVDIYFKDLCIGVLDIETTGLSAQNNRIILGGLLKNMPDGIQTVQYFAEQKEDEAILLKNYTEALSHLDLLISYNGNSFDLPFIARRSETAGIDFRPSSAQNFDLYRIIKKYSQLKQLLPNLKQKTVENFLGLWPNRTDEISGAESVALYETYLHSRDEKLEQFILLHNEDDLLQLSRLLQIMKTLDLHKIMFDNGLIAAWEGKRAYAEKIKLFQNKIKVSGTHKNIDMDLRYFETGFDAHFSKDSGSFLLSIPVCYEEGHVYTDLSDFPGDTAQLMRCGGFQNGYLILQSGREVYYGEINLLILTILRFILQNC